MLHKKVISRGLYPSGFNLLDKEVTNCFLHAEGPGELPSQRGNRNVVGVLTPNGKYREMGHMCAWAHKEIAEAEFPDVFVIIGRGESEGFSTYLFSGWETPFGIVNVDKKRGDFILKNFENLKNEAKSFKDEKTIGSQLPFLQFSNKDRVKDIKIIPILVNSKDYSECSKLGQVIGDLGEDCKVCVVGSCNLYGDVVDNALVDGLKNVDVKKVSDIVKVKNVPGDFIVFVEAVKQLFAKKGDLMYYHPGYASMVFRE